MLPANYNITILQGKTFKKTFQWKTKNQSGNYEIVNIDGYHIIWKIQPFGSNAEIINLQDTGDEPAFTVDTINNKFVLDVTDEKTSQFNFTSGIHQLDIIAPNGEKFCFLTGDIMVRKNL